MIIIEYQNQIGIKAFDWLGNIGRVGDSTVIDLTYKALNNQSLSFWQTLFNDEVCGP